MANYNGWKNRETWLVNLWYGDSFGSMIENEIEEGEYADEVEAYADGFHNKVDEREYTGQFAEELASRYESWVYETIQEQLDSLDGFIRDLIDLECIDWEELAFELINEYFKK